jgi:hypothetical protein
MAIGFYISIAQMPAHNHSASIARMGTEDLGKDTRLASDRGWNIEDHTTYTNNTGGGQPVTVTWEAPWQPYRDVVFIVRN